MPIVLEAVTLESFDWYTLHLGVNLSYIFMNNSRARFWLEALGEI